MSHDGQATVSGYSGYCQRQPASLLSHGNADCGRRHLLSHHPVDRRRRAVPTGVRGRQAERLWPQHDRRGGRGGARGAGWRHRVLGVRQSRGQLHVGARRRVRRRAVLPCAGQVLDDGARSRRARADQARAQRPLRTRRYLRRARHGLDHGLRQGRAAVGRPGAHPAAGHRVEPYAGHEHPGRFPDVASRTNLLQARIGTHPRIPRLARRHHRLPHREPAHSVRPEAASRAADDRPDEPGSARSGAEPGALHAGRRRPAQQLHRADSRVPSGRVRGVRTVDGPLLRPRHRVQDRRCRHGLRVARVGGGKHRSSSRLPPRAQRREARVDSPERHPSVPRGGRDRGARRQEERHHPRADRRGDGGRQSNGSRYPDGAEQSASDAGASGEQRTSGHHDRSDAAALLRHLRARLARLQAGARDRRVRVRHRRAGTQGRQARRRRHDVLRSGRRPSVRSEIGRRAVAAARTCDRRTVSFHRRLGRDHDRQESGRDPRRFERPPLRARQGRRRARQPEGNHSRQRQPEVRLGEEGGSDLLLHGGSARTHPRQLRSPPRHRRAVLRSQSVHAYQPAGRHVGRRLPRVGIRGRRRTGVGAPAALGAPPDHRQEHPRLHAARLPNRAPRHRSC